VTNILARRAGGEVFTNIGDLFGGVSGVFGNDPTYDTAAEDRIARLAELVTVRRNYFTVIVCAQALRDVAGVAYDSDGDGTPDATAAYNHLDVRRAADGTVAGYVDRVQAEQRAIALVERDAFSGKIRVVSFEYVND
jgi:hypothetical protein